MSEADVRYRTRWRPRVLADWASLLFLAMMIPIIYWFEIFVVIPHQFPGETVWYYVNLVVGTFMLINLVSNFAACVVIDTSTRGLMMPSYLPPGWHFCAVCESAAPPRTRHCHTCHICILKRDHHCMFTGCCIGHNTQRYFLSFLLHLCLATAYSTILNHTFVWEHIDMSSVLGLLKIVLPMIVLVLGVDSSPSQLYLLLYAVNVVGVLLSGAFLYHHLRLTLRGQTSRENVDKLRVYDAGWEANLEEAMGSRWYLAWLNPLVPSPLPYDGINWGDRKEY